VHRDEIVISLATRSLFGLFSQNISTCPTLCEVAVQHESRHGINC